MLEMAQIPVIVFQDKTLVKTITLTGPDHGRKNFVIEEELGVSILYLKLRFAQTGMEAKTIHRLLELSRQMGYQKNEENPLEANVLILDECSMIDVMLMYNLLKAIPDDMTLIMVGDTDQLPSVGAGNVLKDIIAS